MSKEQTNHDEQAQKTIERLKDAGSYLVIANFGGSIEIANKGPLESQLLLMKLADLHIINNMHTDFKKY
jgi:hypothetical protein